MLRVVAKSAWNRKRRLIGTVFAIVIGVSFLTATNVLGDTARAGFATVFEEALDGTDAVIRSSQSFSSFEGSIYSPIPSATVDDVAAIDGVAKAAPEVEGIGQILDADGRTMGGDGPPTFAGGWLDDPDLSPWIIVEGRAPAAGEVVIDETTMNEAGVALGETITLLVPEPVELTLVGVVNFGRDASIGGSTFAGMEMAEAQDLLLGGADRVGSVVAAAEPGVTPEALVDRIEAGLPSGLEVITGDELVDELKSDIEGDFLGFMTMALTIFALVALVVAAFSIFNTFSILVAQRTRESALLRALGASRRQVLSASLAESLLIGVIGAVIGAGVGVLLAAGVLAALDNAGFGFPTSGLEVTAGSLAAAGIGGILVTLIGGVVPSLRASRTAPIAALRETAVDSSATSWVRAAMGGAAVAAGVALVALAGDAITLAGVGATLVVIGVVLLGPIVAGPVATLIGSPVRWRGTEGALAQRNAVRNPRRTASTATALLVGIGVVSLFTVFGASIKQSIESEVLTTFAGDLAVEAPGSWSGAGLSPTLVSEIDDLPEVEAAAGLGWGVALVGGNSHNITFSDPAALATVADFDVVAGDIGSIGRHEVAMRQEWSERHGYALGDSVEVTFLDGTTETLSVQALYRTTSIADGLTINAEAWLEHTPQASYFFALASLADGVDIDAGKAAIGAVSADSGAPKVMDRAEFVESQAEEINVLLTVIYVLLAIAIIIALMGIANTMSLSTYERIRELGLLRAVGLTRSQTRSMVRWESVIVATFGSVGGLGVGMFLSWGLVRTLNQSEGFGEYSVPFGQLVFILLIGALVGLLAGLRPAWQAARINVLDAIAEE